MSPACALDAPLGKKILHGRAAHERSVSVSTGASSVPVGAGESLASLRPPLEAVTRPSTVPATVPSEILTKMLASDTFAVARRASAQPTERKSLRMDQSPY